MTKATASGYATYTRLRDGSWGLRAPAGSKPGNAVSVRTKSGAFKMELVGRVLWTGEGIALCTIGQRNSGGWDGDHGVWTRRNGQYHCTEAGCWCGGYDDV